MLSKNAEKIADIQSIARAHKRRLSPKWCCIKIATWSSIPVCSTAPTIINRNIKKPSTSHSTSFENVSCILCSISSLLFFPLPNFLLISLSLTNMSKAAHIRAGTAAGIWKLWCKKKNTTIKARHNKEAFKSFLCLILYSFSISLQTFSKFLIFLCCPSSPLYIK